MGKIHISEQFIETHLNSNNLLPLLSSAWLVQYSQWQPLWQSTECHHTPYILGSERSGVKHPHWWEASHQQLPNKKFVKESNESASYSTGAESELWRLPSFWKASSMAVCCLPQNNVHKPFWQALLTYKMGPFYQKQCHLEMTRWLNQGQYLPSHLLILASEARDSKKPPQNWYHINTQESSSNLYKAAAPAPASIASAGTEARGLSAHSRPPPSLRAENLLALNFSTGEGEHTRPCAPSGKRQEELFSSAAYLKKFTRKS